MAIVLSGKGAVSKHVQYTRENVRFSDHRMSREERNEMKVRGKKKDEERTVGEIMWFLSPFPKRVSIFPARKNTLECKFRSRSVRQFAR